MNLFKKMGFGKADEMETYISYLALRLEMLVVMTGLIVLSFYEYLKTGILGLPFLLMSLGVIVYFSAILYFKRKLGGTGEE